MQRPNNAFDIVKLLIEVFNKTINFRRSQESSSVPNVLNRVHRFQRIAPPLPRGTVVSDRSRRFDIQEPSLRFRERAAKSGAALKLRAISSRRRVAARRFDPEKPRRASSPRNEITSSTVVVVRSHVHALPRSAVCPPWSPRVCIPAHRSRIACLFIFGFVWEPRARVGEIKSASV
ncbi:unnamed protein product [Xylocopa violacea]|uniref:Uncharacterized protein n=1 Tax=Xylocopa violacea TaxID=135666 RepID=A0ABP1MYW4_XYLVO